MKAGLLAAILLFPLGITLYSVSAYALSKDVVALDGTPTFAVPVGALQIKGTCP